MQRSDLSHGARRAPRLRAAGLALVLLAAAARAAPLPEGDGVVTLDAGGMPLVVHTYKPPQYAGGGLLVVLHGLARNAPGYRDDARPLADRHGLLVVAPLFDRERFPTWRYQGGGIARMRGGEVSVAPPEAWIGSTLHAIVAAVRAIEGLPGLPVSYIGHSAGGQALSRYAAFADGAARRIVVANPSTYLWPGREIRYPYGLGGLPESVAGDEMLRRYLAQPLVVLLGAEDVDRDPDLNVSAGAMMQGAHRHARGLAFFRAGERLAQTRGWAFGWRLIEVPGVGHSGRRMLGSEAAAQALAD